jgi:hypothetical protein
MRIAILVVALLLAVALIPIAVMYWLLHVVLNRPLV